MSDLEELASLDALGALDEDGTPELRGTAGACVRRRARVLAEIYDAATAVAAALVTADAPSPRLKDALLARASTSSRGPLFTLRAADAEWRPVMPGSFRLAAAARHRP